MNKIPKKIHYCWFGENKKTDLLKRCIESWKKYCPDYEIIEWNEKNFDIDTNKYTRKAYKLKKWAFVSDYVRIWALYNYGGIYLDTDMEIIKPLDGLLKNRAFLGFENYKIVNFAIAGFKKDHSFLKKMLMEYDKLETLQTIPCLTTRLLKESGLKKYKKQEISNVIIYPKEFFYPFGPSEKYSKKYITKNTYSIHWWDYSWAPFYKKVLKKVGLLKILIKLKRKLIIIFPINNNQQSEKNHL